MEVRNLGVTTKDMLDYINVKGSYDNEDCVVVLKARNYSKVSFESLLNISKALLTEKRFDKGGNNGDRPYSETYIRGKFTDDELKGIIEDLCMTIANKLGEYASEVKNMKFSEKKEKVSKVADVFYDLWDILGTYYWGRKERAELESEVFKEFVGSVESGFGDPVEASKVYGGVYDSLQSTMNWRQILKL